MIVSRGLRKLISRKMIIVIIIVIFLAFIIFSGETLDFYSKSDLESEKTPLEIEELIKLYMGEHIQDYSHGGGGGASDTYNIVNYDLDYTNVVTVAKGGNPDYTTIQGAIDSITDATSIKRYCVKVHPGIYTENITMKDYVDILGSGRTNSIIYGTSGTVLNFSSTKSTVLDMGITVNYGTITANSKAIISSGADSSMIRCDIRVNKTGGDFLMSAINISGGAFRLLDSYFHYNISGATIDSPLIQSAVQQDGALTILLFYNNEITMACDDTNDNLVGFETVTASVGSYLLAENIIGLDTDGGGTSATGLWLYGSATGATVVRNRLIINCDSTAYGLWIESATGVATVNTSHNEFLISSVGSAIAAHVDSGDTWNSAFDRIVAKSANTGTGTLRHVNSLADGNFTAININVTGNISTDAGIGWSGWIDDGANVNVTYRHGIVIRVAGTSGVAGYLEIP